MKLLVLSVLTVFSFLSFVQIAAFLPDGDAALFDVSGRVVDTLKIFGPALILIRPGTRVAEPLWAILMMTQWAIGFVWGSASWRFMAYIGTIVPFLGVYCICLRILY